MTSLKPIYRSSFDFEDGTVIVGDRVVCRIPALDLQGITASEQADGQLIAETFKSASEVADNGYDAQQVVRHLPEILQALENGELDPALLSKIKSTTSNRSRS